MNVHGAAPGGRPVSEPTARPANGMAKLLEEQLCVEAGGSRHAPPQLRKSLSRDAHAVRRVPVPRGRAAGGAAQARQLKRRATRPMVLSWGGAVLGRAPAA